MQKLYITFSGAAYNETTSKLVERATQMGADKVFVYDDRWLMDTEFYRHNHWLWEHHGDQHDVKRGFGWFAWKPFIIMDALDRLAQDGDIILFTDADTYPVTDFSMLYGECERIGGAMLFGCVGWEGCQNVWCKRDCFIVMGQDEEKYWHSDHGCARFMLFQKGKWKPLQFLMEWLTYNVNPTATTFDPSIIGKPEIAGMRNDLYFHEHRCEQAILTNLAHKYEFKLYREACQFGETGTADKDLYPTLFFQDGTVAPRTLVGSAFRNVPARLD